MDPRLLSTDKLSQEVGPTYSPGSVPVPLPYLAPTSEDMSAKECVGPTVEPAEEPVPLEDTVWVGVSGAAEASPDVSGGVPKPVPPLMGYPLPPLTR